MAGGAKAAEVGQRVELVSMPHDPDPIPKGMKGTVTYVDAVGTVHVHWDNGRVLGLIPAYDRWRLIHDGEAEQGQGDRGRTRT